MLKATNLSHSFDYPLYENLSLDLMPKEIVAILGISGSGKSTLLHNLSSFLKPNSGTVEIFGKDIYALNDRELNSFRREKLGLIFQQHYLFRGFSAEENLMVSSLLVHHEISSDLIKRLGIDLVLAQNSADLSGGQQQRVSIARVLIKKPKIILADEPTGNLDKTTSQIVMDTIFEYIEEQNAGMIIATHDESLAMKASRCFRLIDKKLVQVA